MGTSNGGGNADIRSPSQSRQSQNHQNRIRRKPRPHQNLNHRNRGKFIHGKKILSQLMPIDKISGENKKDTRLLQEMAEQARQYLLAFNWCKAIQKGWFGWGVGGIAAVFLFEIEPAIPNVDNVLWVVVGDLPPAYMVTDEIPTPFSEALRTYVDLMGEWALSRSCGQID